MIPKSPFLSIAALVVVGMTFIRRLYLDNDISFGGMVFAFLLLAIVVGAGHGILGVLKFKQDNNDKNP